MSGKSISRRQFIKGTAALAGATLLSSCNIGPFAMGRKLTAVDQVALGKTGIKLSRLGIGTGSKGGSIQRALGADGFQAGMDFEGRSLKSQMKRANRCGARYTLIIGEDEQKKGAAILRDMATKEQVSVPLDNLAENIKLLIRS